MSEHTPGPWRVIDRWPSSTQIGVVDASDRAVCAVAWSGERDEARANAALLAAAPDLLAACEAALFLIDNSGVYTASPATALMLMDAIAKARGGEG